MSLRNIQFTYSMVVGGQLVVEPEKNDTILPEIICFSYKNDLKIQCVSWFAKNLQTC